MALKAIVLTILLGQTLGISPSKASTFTPFSSIITHLRVVDNLNQGLSLFTAETARAKNLFAHLNGLQDGKKRRSA